jgi:hypothetical protein
MTKTASGAFVEVRMILLEPADRAEHLPSDTKRVPFEARIKGFLLQDASLGEKVKIRTLADRVIEGTLTGENPSLKHGFGRPSPELLQISREIRKEIFAETWEK